MFGGYAHLIYPLSAVAPYFERAYHLGLSCGDLPRAAHAASLLGPIWMSMGEGLTLAEEQIDALLSVLRCRTWNEVAITGLVLCKHVILNLTGRTAGQQTLNSGDFDEVRALV